MKVTGFTFIRNGVRYDYPVVESINSILPLCDLFIVAVGNSEDNTLELIKSIDNPRIKIINTEWDDSLRTGGIVLAKETDKAYAAIPEDTDWAFYIQADEVVHESYLDVIRESMLRYLDDKSVDGLLFNYTHFFGSYDYVGYSSQWYEKEIRVIRKQDNIYSYRDAQGFRKGDNQKLRVVPVEASIYHYGWVKEPKTMKSKQLNSFALYYTPEWIRKNLSAAEDFDYSDIDVLLPFKGTHPKVMQKRIAEKNWEFDRDISCNRYTIKERGKRFLRKYLKIDLYYKNYIITRPGAKRDAKALKQK
ncbi:MAG: hypothetical protein PHP30_01715 [Bacteroidales bacterium]|nr:hypothetical protein [Bacteroidales bacterium]MDD3988806.1 hypothetical protein [Bacteroidales bacterium]MDD4639506.1 hypothetical protein [Bacteroidales bacterium]